MYIKKYCNEINFNLLNKKVKLFGWVSKKICFKKIILIKLRDSTGFLLIVIKKEKIEISEYKKYYNISIESCVLIYGIVCENFNNIIEIICNKILILSNSLKLPIDIYNDNNTENIKLKYRYLYLRNSKIINNLNVKSDIIFYTNYYMKKNKFLYIDTPILSKPTLEGADNFLVKSKNYVNKYYSLSQSPQIFKQMLMISGINKYYQIAKCFRNEDSRNNRQPEFTQIDIECSFVNKKKIIIIVNNLLKFLFKKILLYKIKKIHNIKYKESIENFGTDKPDFRHNIRIKYLNNLLLDNKIKIDFNKKHFYIIFIPNYIKKYLYKYKLIFKKKFEIIFLYVKEINIFLKKIKIFKNNKNLIKNILIILNNNNFYKYESLFFIISNNISYEIIGNLIKLILDDNKKLLINKYSFCWVYNFPLFKIDTKNNIKSFHHPFTMPKNKKFLSINKINKNNINKIFSKAYDLIINGNEIASGSERINNSILQKKIFNLLEISYNDQKKIFDFFLNALNYGTPPHAGIALGLERLTMIFTNSNSIKDVMAFPKLTSSYDITIDSPIEF